MKLSLKEARKRATPVALRVKEGTADIREVGGPRTIAFAYSTHEGEEQVYNAAILAHCWNRFDEVVAALENLLEYSQTGCVKGIPREDDLVLDSVAAVLAGAETVEMP